MKGNGTNLDSAITDSSAPGTIIVELPHSDISLKFLNSSRKTYVTVETLPCASVTVATDS